MKRVNIKRDVESRAKIGTTQQPYVPQPQTVVETLIQPNEDAESQENRLGETDQADTPQKPSKRGRTTKGDAQEVPV